MFIGMILNCLAILIGGIIGLFFTNVSEVLKSSIMTVISLIVIYIALDMVSSVDSIVLLMISLVVGTVIGELLNLEDHLNKCTKWIMQKVNLSNKDNQLNIAFINATLFFVVGALSIIGALDSGIRGNHDVLMVKGMMDGVIALIFSTTMGAGVIFSIIPLFLFQGSIILMATQIDRYVPAELLEHIIISITSVGGIIILGIGLNLMNVTNIKITNLLPSIVIGVFITCIIWYL